ncbi:hypothetical protein ABK040_002661 [Willaertia magna]
MSVINISTINDFNKIKKIREEVFIKEQQIDREIEFDLNDEIFEQSLLNNNKQEEKNLFYFLIVDNNKEEEKPLGTCRIRKISTEENKWKIERFAILLNQRNLGIGKKLIYQTLLFIKKNLFFNQQPPFLYLNAQESAIGFYEKCSFNEIGKFETVGELFYEAGIPHREMQFSWNV